MEPSRLAPRNARPTDRAPTPSKAPERGLHGHRARRQPRPPTCAATASPRCTGAPCETHARWHRLELPGVGRDTIYVDRGKGGQVWDIDGNEFVDLRMGYGPVILGHGDARVDDYVNERMRQGVSF